MTCSCETPVSWETMIVLGGERDRYVVCVGFADVLGLRR